MRAPPTGNGERRQTYIQHLVELKEKRHSNILAECGDTLVPVQAERATVTCW
jgi:hypothetical protein